MNRRWSIVLILSTVVLSSCSALRETPIPPSERRLSTEEVQTYSRQLQMPLTGREHAPLIREVAKWMGTPYRYGGSTQTGADCSGFVWSVYRSAFGLGLPRTTTAMARETRRISRRRLQEGDLVFFRMKRRKISHVGIYLGNGHFVHASTSQGVTVNELNEAYYSARFARGGRFRQ